MQVRRVLLAACAALALAGPAMADTKPAAPLPQNQSAFEASLAEAGADLQKGDIAHGREVLERAWRSPAFDKAAPEMRHTVLMAVAGLAIETKDWKTAQAAIVPASEMPMAEFADWRTRLEVAAYQHDSEDAVHALTVMIKRFPEALRDLPDETVDYWSRQARKLPDGQAKQFALIEALFFMGWKPQDRFTDLSDMHMTYALGLIQRGRIPEARTQARMTTRPEAIIMMRADKRYDPMQEHLKPKIGPQDRQADLVPLLAKYPDRLSGPVAQAEVLLDLHKPKDALAVIDAAIAKANAAPDAFIDQDEKLGWALDVRNRVLNALGRRDEALEALAAGARMPEHGQANVNQTLNLAIRQLQNAQPKAALATANTVRLDRMSPYGRAVALQARSCAQAALGQRDEALAGLKDLRAIGDEAKGNTLEVLLCLNDLDGAAALVIERLKSEELRSQTLLYLQKGPAPDFPTPYLTEQEARMDALRRRPDVIAAVEPVGRIETYRPEDLWPTP